MNVTLLVNPAARAGAHTGAATPRPPSGCARTASAPRSSAAGSAAESSELLRTALELGTDAVVVAGGDGTVHLAIQELAGTGIPLGIIPAGTGNDFAATLGLRELDVAAAAETIAAGRTRAIDLARVTRDGRHHDVLRLGARERVRLEGQRPRQRDALAARRLALQHRDPGRVPRRSPASRTRSSSNSPTAPASASPATS